MYKWKVGRDNLAATIYVPYDCKNNCPFCTSKKEYSKLKLDEDAVREALKNLVKNPHIKEVVFTGGEPTANMSLLREMIEFVKKNSTKQVYVNTTLPTENFFDAIGVFNAYVDGVNISRHGTSFVEDCKLFRNIVDDWALKGILVPIKINTVLTDKTSLTDVSEVIDRWSDFDHVTVCFRRDFRKTTKETLHTMKGDPILDFLTANLEFEYHSFCDVCDTIKFSGNVAFHRGLEHSSFMIGNTVVVNDIIVFPDGFISYDWDRKPIEELDGFIKHHVVTPPATIPTTSKKPAYKTAVSKPSVPTPKPTSTPEPAYTSFCGFRRC